MSLSAFRGFKARRPKTTRSSVACRVAEQSLKILADRSRLAYIPLERYELDIELVRSATRDICQRWCVAPFDRMSKTIMVATANPFNKQAVSDLEQKHHTRLLWYLAAPGDLLRVLGKVFR